MKGVFLVYHFHIYNQFHLGQLFKVFLYGTRLDLSFAAYLSVLPLLITLISSFFKFSLFDKIIKWYTLVLLPIVIFICFADLEIYKWWGFRIDSTLFKYMNTPKEVIASIWMSPVFLLLFLVLMFSFLAILGYNKLIYKLGQTVPTLKIKKAILTFVILVLFLPAMFIVIRGGTQLSPINQSAVYFSNNQFLNQAAVNPLWNFVYSILEKNYDEANPFHHFPLEEAKQRVTKLNKGYNGPSIQVLKQGKINVVLIIWESFTAKTVESLGGKKGITPQFDSLCKEGILFNNIYASGDRSDKGLIAVLSSFPAQSITSIMNKTTKAASLPSICKTLKQQNYHTAFYYGGEPEFANIKSYLVASHYDEIIGKENFPPQTWNSKWGAHDEVVLNRMLEDLNKQKQPFFTSLFTLSSHEPFEIPMKPLLPGKDDESKFLNSMHYTDSCVGAFIRQAKQQTWWNNTVIIITADHGHPLPWTDQSQVVNHYPSEFKVPMLWLGGALTKTDTIISTIGSQIDISKTLLKQMSLNGKEFEFSKNLLARNPSPFAYYAYNNGFGFLTPHGHFVFDNVSKNFLEKSPEITENDVNNGKAYLQYSFQEYLNK
jgi:phosphoglycerol transferase MdoB-like AlkP superfamily enzyme